MEGLLKGELPPWLAKVRGQRGELKPTAGQLAVVSGEAGQRRPPPASGVSSASGTPLRRVLSTPRCGAEGLGRGPGGRGTWWFGPTSQPGWKASTALESDKAGWPYGPALAAVAEDSVARPYQAEHTPSKSRHRWG